jgi:hypothetical protein
MFQLVPLSPNPPNPLNLLDPPNPLDPSNPLDLLRPDLLSPIPPPLLIPSRRRPAGSTCGWPTSRARSTCCCN